MDKTPDFEAEQVKLLAQQIVLDEEEAFDITTGDLVCTLDIQYKEEEAYVAMEVRTWGEEGYQIYLSKELCTVPYQPGYFAFREGPVLLAAIQKLIQKIGESPRLLIIDGHGIAHPRKMGLASWVGIKSGIPSLGIAKDTLIHVDYQTLGKEGGTQQKIIVGGEWLGTILRTQTNIKPIFISAGHLINQTSALRICRAFIGKYRIIEPIRMADQAARKFAKGMQDEEMIIL